jgi:hypothetical protein
VGGARLTQQLVGARRLGKVGACVAAAAAVVVTVVAAVCCLLTVVWEGSHFAPSHSAPQCALAPSYWHPLLMCFAVLLSWLQGATPADCQNHLHQLHVCLPSRPGHTRLLYRMATDFLWWTELVPGIQAFWKHIAAQVGPLQQRARSCHGCVGLRHICVCAADLPSAACYGAPVHGRLLLCCTRTACLLACLSSHGALDVPRCAVQVLGEDLVLVQGQQDRLVRGGDTWRHPVSYDKLAVRYRRWRNSLSCVPLPPAACFLLGCLLWS